MSKRKQKSTQQSTRSAPPAEAASPQPNIRWYPWLVFLMSFVLYANTITHDYTQDDAIVITDNMFTQEGVSGISGLLSYDTFFGFFKTEGKAKLVAGGRYRPLTPVMFAIEYELFGRNPMAHHLISVLLYSLLCMLIYQLLILLFGQRLGSKRGFHLFILMCTMIYAAHPLHTEVVANIKGRDEIFSMLGAVAAWYYALRYIDTSRAAFLISIVVVFFLGLMSKETTITYLAVIPLALYFFRSSSIKRILLPTAAAGLATVGFLIIRSAILGMDFGGTPMELMNNPYLKIEGNTYVAFTWAEKAATIIYTLGKYVLLLIFPHPLTHDYYPRHIAMMTFGDWRVILSILTYAALVATALRGWKTKSIVSFTILYFLITLSIVSNVVFPIGTNMSERFMFMPSLGFAIAVGYGLYYLTDRWSHRMATGVGIAIVLLFSIKTITRNNVWKDDFTLFTTDVHTSSNSAKMLNAAGGALVTESAKTDNPQEKAAMLDRAVPYLEKALTIHPNYKNAALLLGNAYFYKSDYENAIKAYERALDIAPGYPDAIKNLAISYRDAGRNAGEKERDLEKAKRYLRQSVILVDNDPDTYRLLGVTYGMSGEHVEAIKYFTKVSEMLPEVAASFVNLGKAYEYYGDEETARIMYQKALNIDPKALDQ